MLLKRGKATTSNNEAQFNPTAPVHASSTATNTIAPVSVNAAGPKSDDTGNNSTIDTLLDSLHPELNVNQPNPVTTNDNDTHKMVYDPITGPTERNTTDVGREDESSQNPVVYNNETQSPSSAQTTNMDHNNDSVSGIRIPENVKEYMEKKSDPSENRPEKEIATVYENIRDLDSRLTKLQTSIKDKKEAVLSDMNKCKNDYTDLATVYRNEAKLREDQFRTMVEQFDMINKILDAVFESEKHIILWIVAQNTELVNTQSTWYGYISVIASQLQTKVKICKKFDDFLTEIQTEGNDTNTEQMVKSWRQPMRLERPYYAQYERIAKAFDEQQTQTIHVFQIEYNKNGASTSLMSYIANTIIAENVQWTKDYVDTRINPGYRQVGI
mgnify:FL=1